MFRFHTGSIKRQLQNAQVGRRVFFKFRFHTGSIKSRFHHIESTLNRGFDSILVRLKDRTMHKSSAILRTFRFHTGSIKSGSGSADTLDYFGEVFRFHTGSIKSVDIFNMKPVQVSKVSIPYWFD